MLASTKSFPNYFPSALLPPRNKMSAAEKLQRKQDFFGQMFSMKGWKRGSGWCWRKHLFRWRRSCHFPDRRTPQDKKLLAAKKEIKTNKKSYPGSMVMIIPKSWGLKVRILSEYKKNLKEVLNEPSFTQRREQCKQSKAVQLSDDLTSTASAVEKQWRSAFTPEHLLLARWTHFTEVMKVIISKNNELWR